MAAPEVGAYEAVLPTEPGDVYADSAFAGDRAWKAIRSRGGMP